jgi:hypothetical protein
MEENHTVSFAHRQITGDHHHLNLHQSTVTSSSRMSMSAMPFDTVANGPGMKVFVS